MGDTHQLPGILSSVTHTVVLCFDDLIHQLSRCDTFHKAGQVEIIPIAPQVSHEDSVMPSSLTGVMNIHNGQLKGFNELRQTHAAHIPFVGLAPLLT